MSLCITSLSREPVDSNVSFHDMLPHLAVCPAIYRISLLRCTSYMKTFPELDPTLRWLELAVQLTDVARSMSNSHNLVTVDELAFHR